MTLGVFRKGDQLFYRLRFNGCTVEREAPKDAAGYVRIVAPDKDAAKILDNAINILINEVAREDPEARGVRICGE